MMKMTDLAAQLEKVAKNLREPCYLEVHADDLGDVLRWLKTLEPTCQLNIEVRWYSHMEKPEVKFSWWNGTKHIDAGSLPNLITKIRADHRYGAAETKETTVGEVESLLAVTHDDALAAAVKANGF